MLAANKVNVARATKAASNRRRLGGPTNAEKEAWRRNLLRARQVLHDDHTWKYATCFRHGLHAVSLERSLVLAGESAEEYQRHLARFDRLVRGLEPGPLSDPAKLARGAALAAWRRLRALRLDHEWTLRAMVEALHQAIGKREGARGDVPSLAGTGSASGGGPGNAGPEAALQGGGPGVVARMLAGGFLDVESFRRLGCDLEDASGSWVRTWPAITRLNNRFDQLWCALVEELGEEPPFLPSSFCWERTCMRASPVVAGYRKWPAEVLGNPLVRPSRVVAQLAGREVRVRPVGGWRCHPLFHSLLEADAYDLHEAVERQAAELDRLEWRRIVAAGDPHYRLLAQARRVDAKAEAAGGPPGTGPGFSAGSAGTPPAEIPPELPETFEEFLGLVERGFGPEPPPGDSTAPGPSSTGEGKEGPADDRGRLRSVAELLWQRVERVRERADQEALELARLLDAYGDQLGRPKNAAVEDASGRSKVEEPTGAAPPWPREGIAARVLRLFRELKAHHVRSAVQERLTRLAIYDLAVARFGKRPEFDELKMPTDRFDQLYHEFFDVFFSQFQPRPDAGSG